MHPHPTDFAHEILIRWMQILAGSITYLILLMTKMLVLLLISRTVQEQLRDVLVDWLPGQPTAL